MYQIKQYLNAPFCLDILQLKRVEIFSPAAHLKKFSLPEKEEKRQNIKQKKSKNTTNNIISKFIHVHVCVCVCVSVCVCVCVLVLCTNSLIKYAKDPETVKGCTYAKITQIIIY